ncbi:MAG: phenylalanine--tRNA ligase subunit beta [Sulfurovum sp.]|nr:phenylalanine--tRNA ligase subunit beta [Sulfurovum sp.]MCB4773059.1 phenylalanine--tRNA ligase subunit beta [Sulfurovum sp.]
MIVTRTWLNEFIDISKISDEDLCETFNAIGLEVDSIKKIVVPSKVVVGEIISCQKHPNADKLNVCQVDIGSGVRQIVCGAANVVDAKYVAVATIGAVLPGNFKIKHAELRGIESEGMICAASELGLPDMGEGIMVLDESIGELKLGQNLNSYKKIVDTIIELELTANRGDCLGIYGVARDLSAALNIEMIPFEHTKVTHIKVGIARKAELRTKGKIDTDLCYKLANIKKNKSNFLIKLRLSIINIEAQTPLIELLMYTIHATGVALRMYDCASFCTSNNKKIIVQVEKEKRGITYVHANEKHISIVGTHQVKETEPSIHSTGVLIEASYIDPDLLSEAITSTKLQRDDLYYRTSRGSNPDLAFGLSYLMSLMERYADAGCYAGSLDTEVKRKNKKIAVNINEISTIIGTKIELHKIVVILKRLGFEIAMMGNHKFAATVPFFRHDIKNIQDIAEEILRIVGINNIPTRALSFVEKMHLNETSYRYKIRKSLRNRAVSVGFYENISYVFSEKAVLQKYGFETIQDTMALANPIAEDLNTLRSTLLVNLLMAVKRNVGYSKKLISLFEIGAVFNTHRKQSEKMAFVFTGQMETENVENAGKPQMIDFATFAQKLGVVIGHFDLVPCSSKNGLIHPYQSADIIVNGHVSGFISKLHPTVQEAYDIPTTFIAEVDFEMLLPKHINAEPISKFQGVYKDISIVIDKSLNYFEVAKVLNKLNLPMLKESYPIDIYTDKKLGDKKSLTIRFFIQSMDKTLEENDIESMMNQIMETLQKQCGAELR